MADLCRQRRAELSAQACEEREADIRELAETLQWEQGQAVMEQEAKRRAYRQDVAHRWTPHTLVASACQLAPLA